MRTKSILVSLAVAVLVISCVSPSYVVTKAACADAMLRFGDAERDGSLGLTDTSGDINVETVLRLLGEGRLRYFEQYLGKSYSSVPLWVLFPNAPSDSFARLEITSTPTAECSGLGPLKGDTTYEKNPLRFISRSGLGPLRDGTVYKLYTYGMMPSECLQAATVLKPSGRFVLRKEFKKTFDATITEHTLVDGSGVSATATITSARSRNAPGSYGGAIIQDISPALEASCHADPQSVAEAFQRAEARVNNSLPAIRNLEKPNGSLTIPFHRSQLSLKEFRTIVENPEPHSLSVAQNGFRAIVVKDQKFVDHWNLESWRNCMPMTLPLDHHVLLLSFNETGTTITVVGVNGTKQNTYIANLENTLLPLVNAGDCGSLTAAVQNGMLYMVANIKGESSTVSRGVYETSLRQILSSR